MTGQYTECKFIIIANRFACSILVICIGLMLEFHLKDIYNLSHIRSVVRLTYGSACLCSLSSNSIITIIIITIIIIIEFSVLNIPSLLTDDKSFFWNGRNIEERFISKKHSKVTMATWPGNHPHFNFIIFIPTTKDEMCTS